MAESSISPQMRRRSVLIGGTVLLLLGIYILVFLIPDVIRTAGGPVTLTMVEAAERATDDNLYTTIEDGTWVCDSITQVRTYSTSARRFTVSSTSAFRADASNDIAIWVSLSGDLDCADLQRQTPSGYLKRMQNDTRMDLAGDAQMVYVAGANTFLEMCGYCGQTNSLIGAVFGTIFIISGVGLLGFWWIKLRPSATTLHNDSNSNQETNDL